MNLSTKKCVPCEGNVKPMNDVLEDAFVKKVDGWEIVRDGIHLIRKEFTFKDFKQAMEFVNKVAGIAESEGHHPDIYIYYNKVELELHTHAIGGLHENDFIVAAKINDVGI